MSLKQKSIKDAFALYPHLRTFEPDPVLPSLRKWNYRNKVLSPFHCIDCVG